MKTDYKFIKFVPVDEKTNNWICLNIKHNEKLGTVHRHENWKMNVFSPVGDCMFSQDCLSDVMHFLSQLNLKDALGK